MKIKRTALQDNEKKRGWRCSRCGYYIEKQQIFSAGEYGKFERGEDPYLRRRAA